MNNNLKYRSKISHTVAIALRFKDGTFGKDESMTYKGGLIESAGMQALRLQPNGVSDKDLLFLSKRFTEFDDATGLNEIKDPTVLLCFTLILIERTRKYITNFARREALTKTLKRLNWLLIHKDIDPKINKDAAYDEAVALASLWKKIVER